MDKLTKKTLNVTRSHTYTYYTHGASTISINSNTKPKPAILLIHGWPDTAEVWSDLIANFLIPQGYGIIALDCLGWGGSSKPLDEREYDFRLMSQDMVEILEEEGVEKVVVLAHDWGAGLASRFYNFHPSLVLALILTNTNYFLASAQPFLVDDLITLTVQAYGYGIFWYWHLFASDSGPQILADHIDSLWTVLHSDGESWLETFCKENGFRDSLLEDRMLPLLPYATEKRKDKWVSQMRQGGFAPGLMWYRALARGFQDEANKAALVTPTVTVPYLLVQGRRDVCCRIEDYEAQKQAGMLGDDAEAEVVKEAGHWVMLSHPGEYGEKVVGWLERKGF